MRKITKPALVVLAVGVAGAAAWNWWRGGRPREIGVCVYTDYSFRQRRQNWEQVVAARFREANRIFQSAKVQWKIVSDSGNDPTAATPGYDARRSALDDQAQCAADVIVSMTGQAEGRRGGSVSPFSRTGIVADHADKAEAENVRLLVKGLASFFGAPIEPAGAGTALTDPPESDSLSPKAARLVRDLRGYDFAAGIDGLTTEWDKRAFGAIEAAAPANVSKPSAQARRVLAGALASEHRMEKAVVHLREAAKLDPGNAALRAELASALSQVSQGPEALKEIAEAVRLEPNTPLLRVAYGGILARQGDPEGAIEQLRKSVDLAPNNPFLHLSLASALERMAGQTDAAIASYQAALRLAPDSAVARFGLERSQGLKQRAYDEAAQLRQRAQQNGANPAAYYSLGIAELRAGNLDASVRALERAVELNPRAGGTHASLAQVRYMRGDYAGAWKSIQAARAANFEPAAALIAALKRKQAE